MQRDWIPPMSAVTVLMIVLGTLMAVPSDTTVGDLLYAQEPVVTSKADSESFAMAKSMTLLGSSGDATKTYKLGQKIVISYDGQIPKGGRVSILWRPDDSLEIEQAGNRIFIWTTTAGPKNCDATVIPLRTLTVEGQTFDVLAGPPVNYPVRFIVEGGNPKPNPPKPGPGPTPDPDKTSLRDATRIVIVMDTGSDTQKENETLLGLRSNPEWSSRVLILDKGQAPAKYQPANTGAESFPAFNAENSEGKIYRKGHIDEFFKELDS